jgi:hypothetical protein
MMQDAVLHQGRLEKIKDVVCCADAIFNRSVPGSAAVFANRTSPHPRYALFAHQRQHGPAGAAANLYPVLPQAQPRFAGSGAELAPPSDRLTTLLAPVWGIVRRPGCQLAEPQSNLRHMT